MRCVAALTTFLATLLTFGLGPVAASATYPGLNGKIAYSDVVDRDSPVERQAIFLRKSGQFTHPTPRPYASDSDSYPAWSPDGRLLAFVRRDGLTANYKIFVVKEDGSNLRELYSTGQLVNGLPGPLNGQIILSLSWKSDGHTILFAATGGAGAYSVGQADTGTNVPLGGAGSNVVGVSEAGEHGVVTGCPAGVHRICIVDDLGGIAFFDVPALPDVSASSFAMGIARWWPKNNQRKLAFMAVYIDDGISHSAIFSAEYDANGNSVTASRLERVTLPTGLVTCSNTNPVTGITTTTQVPKYKYRDPVPSPDGKYIVVHRVEAVTEFDLQGTCSFDQARTGLFILRNTGEIQAELAREDAKDAAWQPDPANLAVHVTDGHDHPLDGLKLELLDLNDPAISIGITPENDSPGTYTFDDVVPGEYRVRAMLVENEGNAFDIRHDRFPDGDSRAGPVWIDRQVDVSADQPKVDLEFPIADIGVILTSNVDQGNWDRLDDMAAIYYQTHQFVKWIRANLTETTGPSVPFFTFATSRRDGAFVTSTEAVHISGPSEIYLGTGLSAYEMRDDDRDFAPINAEWHEFTHHLFTELAVPFDCGPQDNHGGYSNFSTCDSLHEGFASFLPTQVKQNPDYVGIANLERQIKAWDVRFSFFTSRVESDEDLAVAALFWDIVDATPDAEYTVAIASNGFHVPVTYADDVSVPLRDLWQLLVARKPTTIVQLQGWLDIDLYPGPLTIDLDSDGIDDVNPADPLFLMHGFFPIIPDQVIGPGHGTYHFDVADARLNGPPGTLPNQDVGFSSHQAFNFAGQLTAEFLNRQNLEPTPEANLDLQVLDASGTPLYGANVELTVVSPDSVQATEYKLGAGDDSQIHLELPSHFQYLLPEDAPIPACDPATDYLVDVTVVASVNGYVSLDTPGFDNCEYLQGMIDSPGDYALSVALTFPEDSTAPITTLEARTLGEIFGEYTLGSWTVGLSCEDPVDGDFASGCWRSEYSLDGGVFAPYTEEIEITEPGLHTVAYHSVDAASNEESVATVNLGIIGSIENTPPVTTATADPSVPPVGGFTTGFWTVTLSCEDLNPDGSAGSGCVRTEFRDGGSTYSTYTGPLIVAAPGVHYIYYRSIDLLENAEADRYISLVVGGPDVTPPVTFINYISTGPQSPVFDQTMGFWTVSVYSCSDTGGPYYAARSGCSHTEFSLDGAPYQPLIGEVVVGELGQHSFEYRSVDVAGNVEVAKALLLEVVAPSDLDGDGLLDFEDNCSDLANADQLDTDFDSYGNACDADFNGNGTVDSNDASLLKARLGETAGTAPDQDLDGDGLVNAADMNVLRARFRMPPGPAFGYDSLE